MTDARRQRLSRKLSHLEQVLRELGDWSALPPSPQALASTVPFAADHLPFSAWLQWIFIARMRALLEGSHALPGACLIAPMAEEALKQDPRDLSLLLQVLRGIDAEFADPDRSAPEVRHH